MQLSILLITIIIFPTFILTAVSAAENYFFKLPHANYELQIHTILTNDFHAPLRRLSGFFESSYQTVLASKTLSTPSIKNPIKKVK